MSLTVGDLVARPELATRVLAGATGLERDIDWAHVCELRDPWHWVGSGNLLMTTGLGVPIDPGDQVDYVERLVTVGAAGVAVGEDMEAPALDSRMLETADRHGFPILLTRRDIPFIALARAVAEANAEAHLSRLDQTERVYEVLRRSSADELDLAGLRDSLAAIVGCRLWVIDPVTARSLVPGEALPEPLVEAIRRWRPAGHEEAPTSFSVNGVEAVGVVVPSPRPAVLVASTPPGGHSGPPPEAAPGSPGATLPDATVLRHVAAAIALHQTRLSADRERSLRLGASLLAQLLDQRISASAARERLATAELDGTDLVLAACTAASERDDLHPLHHHLADTAVPHLLLVRPPLTLVLLPSDAAGIRHLTEGLPDDVAVGISDPLRSPADLPGAQSQARWALHRAQERRVLVLHHSDELGDSVFLPGDHGDSRAAAERVLGPLLVYDRAHQAHLMESLRIFLEENRSWQRAAARLHIHKQTLVYRMRRVEDVTGRSLSDTADVADVWLAMRAAAWSGLVDR